LVRQVQRLVGFEEAQPNADAVLPALMTDAIYAGMTDP
jgi:hypothetical protein